jgi:hypothetical protein
MKKKLISRYIFIAISLWIFTVPSFSQKKEVKQNATIQKAKDKYIQPHDTLFRGVAVSGDIVGLLMKPFGSKFGSFEGAARINLYNKYFPIGEIGYAFCDNRDDQTNIHYKTNAPYFRVGLDYNFLKDKNSGNRIFAGVRYAFTSFKYDIEDPNFSDPVWLQKRPYNFKGIKSGAQWAELVVGAEAKIWSIFHLGWSARYKIRLHQKESSFGDPWYIPGFGKNGSSTCWGGTFNIIFDV